MSVLRSVAEVIAAIPEPTDSRVIVGIVGPPGSGKSTIAALVVDAIGRDAALLAMDGFHLPQARLVELGRRDRMGASDTFDVDGFLTVLAALRSSGGVVSAPGFDREIEEPVPDAITIAPEKRVVIVEGNYLLHDSGGWERAAPFIDTTFFVSVDHGIRLERLIARHVRFGKTPGAASTWANGPDEANARVIEQTAVRADHRIELD